MFGGSSGQRQQIGISRTKLAARRRQRRRGTIFSCSANSPDTTLLFNGHVLPDDYQSLRGHWTETIWGSSMRAGSNFANTTTIPAALIRSCSRRRRVWMKICIWMIGKAWVDFGLTLPDWPRLVLGYEYDYRVGQRSAHTNGARWAPTLARPRTLPRPAKASTKPSTSSNLISMTTSTGVTIEDRFRGEFYDLKTSRHQHRIRSARRKRQPGHQLFSRRQHRPSGKKVQRLVLRIGRLSLQQVECEFVLHHGRSDFATKRQPSRRSLWKGNRTSAM